MELKDSGQCFYARYVNLDTNFIRLHFKLTETTDVDLIHDIRVSIKKIRTFYRLMAFIYPKFNFRQNFSPYKKLFVSAGMLRTNHVYQEIISSAAGQIDFDFDLQKQTLLNDETEIALNFKEQFNLMDIYDFIKVRGIIRHITANHFNIKKVEAFVERIVNRILEISNHDVLNPHYLHELRKHFKDLDYILIWINKCHPEPAIRKEDYDRIHDFQEIMGKWHDVYDSLMYFQNLKLTGKKEYQSEQFTQLIHHLIHIEIDHYNTLISELMLIKTILANYKSA